MRSELITDLFNHLARELKFTVDHAPREIEGKLEALALPMDVKRLLQWTWPRSMVRVGPYTLDAAEDIIANDDRDRLLSASMVPIGYARNGDILVIQFANHGDEVGLVSPDEGEASASEAYVPVCRTVDEYLYRAAEGRYLPLDSRSAEEWQQLLEELKSRGGA